MKLLSDACEYALPAVVWLAQQPAGAYKVREIAQATRTPPGYLVKVLQQLAREIILSGQRGSHGGFTLIRDHEDLTVLEIINIVDPMERIHTCPLGLKSHGNHLCPMHRRVDDAMAAIERGFATSTIADLTHAANSGKPSCNALSVPLEQIRPTQASPASAQYAQEAPAQE